MSDSVREDILDALDNTILAIKEQNVHMLKELSNRTIHNATLFQDWKSINVAVVIYALSKIIDRQKGKLPNLIFPEIKKCVSSVRTGKDEKLRNSLNSLLKIISGVDHKLKWYIDHVVEQAQVKKGSRIYEHGISLARAAELLGISTWDLMNYTGKTNIADKFSSEIDIKDRMDFTREVFS